MGAGYPRLDFTIGSPRRAACTSSTGVYLGQGARFVNDHLGRPVLIWIKVGGVPGDLACRVAAQWTRRQETIPLGVPALPCVHRSVRHGETFWNGRQVAFRPLWGVACVTLSGPALPGSRGADQGALVGVEASPVP